MTTFTESGMTFGPFDKNKVYQIEKSKSFQKCNGIKTVEFIFKKKSTVLMFIEAKASSPIQREGNEENYSRFIHEIKSKFIDSFHLYIACLWGRKSGHEELPSELKNLDLQNVKFKFILVINGHENTWLPPLQHELEKNLKEFQSIWNNDIIVLNDTLAKECKLIA